MTSDEAITVGLRKYREMYPEGTVPPRLETKAVLSALPGKKNTTVTIAFSLKGKTTPFVLFRAIVDHECGCVTVTAAADWRAIEPSELDDFEHVQAETRSARLFPAG